MAESKSRGQIQVASNDPAEINRALALLTQWIDELTGLRGAVVVYDTVKYQDSNAEVIHGFGDATS